MGGLRGEDRYILHEDQGKNETVSLGSPRGENRPH